MKPKKEFPRELQLLFFSSQCLQLQISINLIRILIFQENCRAMGEIDFTNIIIDDFRKGKMNPFNKFIYILSHIHSDHLRGLNNSWDYGPIYCSQITANLIINKFPKLVGCVKVLPLQQPCKITLAENTIATVTFFDANHCAGSVMILLQGYFGRFLYTGDFRFDRQKFSSYSYLYPPQNCNQKFQGCSRPIDKLWLDNTFCHPRFKFLVQKQAYYLVKSFISQNLDKRIYVGMDYYGKQEVLIAIAKQFDTLIVVDQQKYQSIIAMEFDRQLFTTNPQQGHIQIIQKPKLYERLEQEPDAFGLVMSGWCLKEEWKKVKGSDKPRIYYVPYSLHSNFDEMVGFVKSIRPALIQPIVPMDDKITGGTTTESMYNTEGHSQAFKRIVEQYTSPMNSTYFKNLKDDQFQNLLKKRFGLDRKSTQINKQCLGFNTLPARPRGKGYKLPAIRDEQQINKVKQLYKRTKQMRNAIVINDDQSDDSSELQIIDKIDNEMEDQSANNNQINGQDLSMVAENQQQNIKPIAKPDLAKVNSIKLVLNGIESQNLLKQKIRKHIINLIN